MRSHNIQAILLLAATTAGVGALASCSDDDNPAPSGVIPSEDAGVDTGTSVVPETGACTSDAATCNSCATPAEDPYNACSESAGNCVPFDNERVPRDPNGALPQVP